MEESRKLFERYAAGRLRLPLEMIAAARGGDRYLHSHDSMCIMHPLNEWWAIWQASRSSIEIELPRSWSGEYNTLVMYSDEVESSIRAAGLTVKGDSK